VAVSLREEETQNLPHRSALDAYASSALLHATPSVRRGKGCRDTTGSNGIRKQNEAAMPLSMTSEVKDAPAKLVQLLATQAAGCASANGATQTDSLELVARGDLHLSD
jgi:hypothetical protein